MARTGSGKKLDLAFAGEIKRLREDSGLSQTDLASELGVDQSLVSRVEAGSRQLTLGQAMYWLQALGLSCEDASSLVANLWGHNGARPRSFWSAEN
ncbi:helix-turn-helix transcriptional regulator [Trueperella pyogenes]|uniref:helix-turn-helix transcriptional regulator n=1 Tax=Trueperella pyogenes TaxID=1661 RepID=UPI003D2FAE32